MAGVNIKPNIAQEAHEVAMRWLEMLPHKVHWKVGRRRRLEGERVGGSCRDELKGGRGAREGL